VADALSPRLAAPLRAYPFYNFNRARVATRAYFLGEKSDDFLKNWLDAEFVESFVQGDEALVFPPGALDFLREYELVEYIRFLTNEPRKKEFRGDRAFRSDGTPRTRRIIEEAVKRIEDNGYEWIRVGESLNGSYRVPLMGDC
jgi:hypothetical protein